MTKKYSANEQERLLDAVEWSVPAFWRFLQERFPGRIDLGERVAGPCYSSVPVLIDGESVGEFTWETSISWDPMVEGEVKWWDRYVGRIPGYKNGLGSEDIILGRGIQLQYFPREETLGIVVVRIDGNIEIPFQG